MIAASSVWLALGVCYNFDNKHRNVFLQVGNIMLHHSRVAFGLFWTSILTAAGVSCVKTSFTGSSKQPVSQGAPAVPAPGETDKNGTNNTPVPAPVVRSPVSNQPWWAPVGTIVGPPITTTQPANPSTQTQTTTPTKPPVVVYTDPKLPDAIHLQAIRRNHEAWWKTCFFVQVAADGHASARIPLGCNKDRTPPTFIDLPAKKGTCNLLWLYAETTKNDSGTCGSTPCTYGPSFSFGSSASNTAAGSGHQKYMMFAGENVKNVMNYPGFSRLIRLTPAQTTELAQVAVNAANAKAAQQNWARIYYEDQQVDSVLSFVRNQDWSTDAANSVGVDYNDFVLDLVGDPGIPFKFTATVSGSLDNFYAQDRPSQYVSRASFCN